MPIADIAFRQNEVSIESNHSQYAYASRLPGEPPFADGVTANTLHVHPSTPRIARVGLKLLF